MKTYKNENVKHVFSTLAAGSSPYHAIIPNRGATLTIVTDTQSHVLYGVKEMYQALIGLSGMEYDYVEENKICTGMGIDGFIKKTQVFCSNFHSHPWKENIALISQMRQAELLQGQQHEPISIL